MTNAQDKPIVYKALKLDASIELPPILPLFVPKFNLTIERVQEIVDQMQVMPLPPTPPPEPTKQLPVDREFIDLLHELRPTPFLWPKPANYIMSEEDQKLWNATRMREYRRKSNELIERSKEMLNGLKAQCTINTVILKNLLDKNTAEEEVKRKASQFLRISQDSLMLIPEILQLFQQYWRHRENAAESHFEMKSLVYLEKVFKLMNDYDIRKANKARSRSLTQMMKKIKDATLKAEAYEFFMDNKRVRKVIAELHSVDTKFKETVEFWLVQQLQPISSDVK
ncbi:unnamed protein product [Caenorhabditis nigoni]